MKSLLLLFALAATLLAEAPPTLQVRRVDQPPRLADYLNGTPPDPGTPVTGFRQRDPHDGQPVSQPTRANGKAVPTSNT